MSRPAVAGAAGSSCAVVVVAALGGLTTPVIAAALGLACGLALLSHRAARPGRKAHALLPLEETGPVVIHAPRATGAAGHAPSESDAA